MDDLDHHLAGPDRLDDGGANRLGARAIDERAHDLERDVRLEQRAPDLAHRGVDVLLREGASAGQFIEYAGELFGQALEHEARSFGAAEGGTDDNIAPPYRLPIRPLFSVVRVLKPTPIAPGGATRCRKGERRPPADRSADRRGQNLTKFAPLRRGAGDVKCRSCVAPSIPSRRAWPLSPSHKSRSLGSHSIELKALPLLRQVNNDQSQSRKH